jgi:hypothetical protein
MSGETVFLSTSPIVVNWLLNVASSSFEISSSLVTGSNGAAIGTCQRRRYCTGIALRFAAFSGAL